MNTKLFHIEYWCTLNRMHLTSTALWETDTNIVLHCTVTKNVITSFHITFSLYNFIAKCHDTLSLYTVIVQCHCTLSPYTVTVHFHCTLSLHNIIVYSYCTLILYTIIVHSIYTVKNTVNSFFYNKLLFTLSWCTVTLHYN